ncbi:MULTISPECIES: hypothetical protein [unclassified Coleofasciculus]|uniref:hypothetical protein n=1 Tax=unclassified Coleofasciculus TaxID=2692782 RepID=UPI0018819A25|nr:MULTISPECIES: hypothetical protein [unclassified Coleofasciculus]MBE9126753.1 hypothetical protein [Coleofasciculus sp. LEGE 07081]MBE9150124.1 hypothetical protein [Coleofasciculus sp. LEGE 07092]
MRLALRYWTTIAINAAGQRKREEIAPAKAFFLASFPEFTIHSEVSDALVQRQLLHWFKRGTQRDEKGRFLAQLCLKCFISSQIERVCQQLAVQFGTEHSFTCGDLLPFVLDDDSRRYAQAATNQSPAPYQSFSDEILQSFDPEQSSLATWTTRRVRHHRELNDFLLEQGVYLVSDWAILNDTTPKQLDRIFSQFHQLTTVEIQQAKQLLENYHAVYRAQRLKQRQAGIKGKCLPPTREQLNQINQRLSSLTPQMLSEVTLLTKLQEIASRLRQYRIHVRGGALPKDETDPMTLAERIPYPNSDTTNDQTEFLRVYRQHFLTSLDQAIAQVTSDRVTKLQCKDPQKAQGFIIALQLFHCQERSMSDIAKQLNLKAQFHVSRLLKLKAFRADIQRELLVYLRDRIFEQAKTYIQPERLQTFHQQIEDALNEQVTHVIEEAATEASTATVEKHRSQSSLFSRRLCRHLDTRSNP